MPDEGKRPPEATWPEARAAQFGQSRPTPVVRTFPTQDALGDCHAQPAHVPARCTSANAGVAPGIASPTGATTAMTIQTATYRNIRIQSPTYARTIASRVDTFSNTFRYRAEDGKVAQLAPVSQKSLSDLTRKDA